MKDELGDRMKDEYESRTRYFLPRRTFTIIRLDGKAFHTFTRGLQRPFDDTLIHAMDETTKYLCSEIMGCKIGYTQSDEITLVLTDFDNEKTEAWFDGNIQKITSISASLATAKFNSVFSNKKDILATFDSRVFTISNINEVINCLYWRQKDATRNSIQMVAQSLYSHKQLHGKGWSDLNELLFQKGVNFDEIHSHKKRGRLITKVEKLASFTNRKTGETNEIMRSSWEVMDETPYFNKDSEMIKKLILGNKT